MSKVTILVLDSKQYTCVLVDANGIIDPSLLVESMMVGKFVKRSVCILYLETPLLVAIQILFRLSSTNVDTWLALIAPCFLGSGMNVLNRAPSKRISSPLLFPIHRKPFASLNITFMMLLLSPSSMVQWTARY